MAAPANPKESTIFGLVEQTHRDVKVIQEQLSLLDDTHRRIKALTQRQRYANELMAAMAVMLLYFAWYYYAGLGHIMGACTILWSLLRYFCIVPSSEY